MVGHWNHEIEVVFEAFTVPKSMDSDCSLSDQSKIINVPFSKKEKFIKFLNMTSERCESNYSIIQNRKKYYNNSVCTFCKAGLMPN